MAGEIKISDVVASVQTALPSANTLSCSELTQLAKTIISNLPSNDCIYEGQAKCELLVAAARLNKAKASVDVGSKKREKVGEVEVEYSTENTRFIWDDFIKSAKNDICPIFGYKYPVTKGMIISPSEKIKVNNCEGTDELYL